MCHLINQSTVLVNKKSNTSVNINSGGNCKSKNIIYAARCKVHDMIYIGHTGEELCRRFSKHRYDAKNRPDNNELANHLSGNDHDFEKDIEVSILKNNVRTPQEREFCENRFICLLGTKSPNGLNIDMNNYGKEMYNIYSQVFPQQTPTCLESAEKMFE